MNFCAKSPLDTCPRFLDLCTILRSWVICLHNPTKINFCAKPIPDIRFLCKIHPGTRPAFCTDSRLWVKSSDNPFSKASVEVHLPDSQQRHDLCLYSKYDNQPVMTGEIKMPDAPAGRHPLSHGLVQDALTKAFHAGVKYCFTWNVRQFVLFDSQRQNVPMANRSIEGPTTVVETTNREDLARENSLNQIRGFWENFLEDFAELLAAKRPFQPPPIDQRFIAWLDGALEDPISHTTDTLLSKTKEDPGFSRQLNQWLLSQGWELSTQENLRRQNIERASKLSCYLDFTHFKRYKRRNLQYAGTEWRGVSVHRSWRSIVKNPPTPTTSGYAQR